MVQKGVDIKTKDGSGRTALHLSVENGHKMVVQLLLEKGAYVDAKDNSGNAALHHVMGCDLRSEEELLTKEKSRESLEEMALLLIKNGANMEIKDKHGCTPLHSAALSRGKPMVELLVENGAYVNAKDNYGQTALHHVVRYHYQKPEGWAIAGRIESTKSLEKMAQLLIENGASVEIKDKHGITPLEWARANSIAMAKLLDEYKETAPVYGMGSP